MYISIGLPFYNAERFLEMAIKSVFAQTYQKWELILIDDGSSDNSLKIAQSINDPRVRVISDGKNKKLATRLNELNTLAKYDYIARMDADDIMSPDRLEKQIEIFKIFPHLDLVTTGLYSMSNNNELIGARWHTSNNINHKELLFKKGCGVVHAAILAKKSWYHRNMYDQSLKIAQDYDLWLRASKNSDFNIFLIQEPLYYYREEDNATPTKILAAYENERRMYKKYAGNYKLLLIVKSFIKSGLVKILQFTNQYDLLIQMRSNNSLENNLLAKFKNELNVVDSTTLPLSNN